MAQISPARLMHLATLMLLMHWALVVAASIRVLLRPHREPASRVAWLAVIGLFPAAGVVIYLLLGEVNPGSRRLKRLKAVAAGLPPPPGADDGNSDTDGLPEQWRPLFRMGRCLTGFGALSGHAVTFPPDSNAVIDRIVDDIGAATEHVHLLYYIWLPDRNGSKVVAALCRAARRGVACRVMVDALGSRHLIRSRQWNDLRAAGVRTAVAYPMGPWYVGLLRGRPDLRNHRKIVVIDGRITFCGSQNCADPEFTIKAGFAPWVDAVLRLEGPVARQNLHLFARDWTSVTGESLEDLLKAPGSGPGPESGCIAQVLAGGPSFPPRVIPGMFVALLFAAREEVTITTPYYVPDESLQHALCDCARRGVKTTLILPARNNSALVAAASRSYYPDLLQSGVRLFEFTAGLLHSKSVVADGAITLFGSANMDRRSFELNQENNVLICDPQVAVMVLERQQAYLRQSVPVDPAEVAEWSMWRQLRNNAAATLGPQI